jgi:hypothetical protein
MNLKIVGLALTFGIALLNFMGAIDSAAMVKGIVEDVIINPLTDPHKMDLHIDGATSERITSLLGLIYNGYKVTMVGVNSGSSGYATIECDAYDTTGQLRYSTQIYPHFKRNQQQTLTCEFNNIPDSWYQFKVNIISQRMDV